MRAPKPSHEEIDRSNCHGAIDKSLVRRRDAKFLDGNRCELSEVSKTPASIALNALSGAPSAKPMYSDAAE